MNPPSKAALAAADLPAAPAPAKAGHDDGRSRLVGNVLASWAGQFIRIFAGFIMPRLIDAKIGQEALGVWDVSWAIMAHITLVQAGISGSINRYVARCLAAGDEAGLNRVVSSVAGVMRSMGALVFVLAIASALFLEKLTGASLGPHLGEARWVVFIIGVSSAVQLSTGMYGGVITGFHRWDLHNLGYIITNVTTLLGGTLVLSLGGGLVGLAATCLAAEFAARVLRWHYAYKLCPGLEIRWGHFRWHTAKELMRFGGKMFLVQISQLVLNQTLNFFIALNFGPAALALFARPAALIKHTEAIITKYANVLVPTAGVMQATDTRQAQQQLAIQSSRAAAYMCLPVVLFLVVLGDQVIHLWMGGRYVLPGLASALALGWFMYLANIPLFNVLSGFDLHGRVATANIIAAALALPSAWIAVRAGGGLIAVSVASIAPIAAMNAFWLPAHACRLLGIPIGRYLSEVWSGPLLCAAPFAGVLVAARLALPHSPAGALLSGLVAGGLVLAALYWRLALPETWRTKILRRLAPRRGA